MKVIPSLLAALALGSASTLAHSYDFVDGFESGDMNSSNSKGFKWAGDNGNAIFNSRGMIWKDSQTHEPPLTSYSNPYGKWKWVKDENSLWTARNGSNFLNFIYNDSKNWAERRFEFGTGMSEVWIKFWLRIPTNYYMREAGECSSSSSGDKFFALWQDGYSGRKP